MFYTKVMNNMDMEFTMNNKKLSFADINILREDIAEVIVHEGIEMDLAMVDEYHAYLQKHLQSPFSLLVNKK